MKRLAIIWGSSAGLTLPTTFVRWVAWLTAIIGGLSFRDAAWLVGLSLVARGSWLGYWVWAARIGTRRSAVRRLLVATLIASGLDVFLWLGLQAANGAGSVTLSLACVLALAVSAYGDAWHQAVVDSEKLTVVPRPRVVLGWLLSALLVSGAALSLILRDRGPLWFGDEWLYWFLFGWPAAAWVATLVRAALLKLSQLRTPSPAPTGTDSLELRRFASALGGVLTAAVLVGGVALAIVSMHESRVKRGWNLVPVLVPQQATLAPISVEILSERRVPEQLVTSSIVSSARANLVIGESLTGPVVPGAPILWDQLIKGDERCAVRVEAAARTIPPAHRDATWRLIDAWYGEAP